jgi:hypothetical protein
MKNLTFFCDVSFLWPILYFARSVRLARDYPIICILVLKKKVFLLLRTKLKQVFQVPMFLVQFSHFLLFFAIAIFLFFFVFPFFLWFSLSPCLFFGFSSSCTDPLSHIPRRWETNWLIVFRGQQSYDKT